MLAHNLGGGCNISQPRLGSRERYENPSVFVPALGAAKDPRGASLGRMCDHTWAWTDLSPASFAKTKFCFGKSAGAHDAGERCVQIQSYMQFWPRGGFLTPWLGEGYRQV